MSACHSLCSNASASAFAILASIPASSLERASHPDAPPFPGVYEMIAAAAGVSPSASEPSLHEFDFAIEMEKSP